MEELNAECDEIDEQLSQVCKQKSKLSIKLSILQDAVKPIPDSRLKELEESNKQLRLENRSLYKQKIKVEDDIGKEQWKAYHLGREDAKAGRDSRSFLTGPPTQAPSRVREHLVAAQPPERGDGKASSNEKSGQEGGDSVPGVQQKKDEKKQSVE